MERKIIITDDGSTTIHIPEWNEQYHSTHGAIQEAKHVYLEHGLAYFCASEGYMKQSQISILEIGFGTGLNAFLTAIKAKELNLNCNYVGVEGFPISKEELKALNYSEVLKHENTFNAIHDSEWESSFTISENFNLKKQQKQFSGITDKNKFDIVYFDAFGPRVQPELWTEAIFKSMYEAMKPNGVLVTYCAQGHARRAMISVGFTVEKVKGPPGKRHMLRAVKL
ncbi:tRNA (5-methylaminomethyl-2-thiouridine)(34)-methyltransferase MnmD [Lacinutrix sp. Bg11-31]|uniref:tRNA (5-methylaminomethyl-2-thiouridine)(34)-methyltransferase MnmD n=1 Tax=Lacinutrix sp. Bg11-31 TaxID=2057808 RepID=UPI000C312997|nr:tRNA (5-methylaminomethyl-2-thiouridine)(34)-methyltransferase MnmD [Lacinutrix sp. Bg11-31]AUC80676.1 SAM-dependent methyltransferase [Lacinutrix sp. Bg11-31]